MSEAVLVYGNSGAGKTHSVQFLEPKETFIIDADLKGLNWKGWKKLYNKESKNYIRTSDVPTIQGILSAVSTKDEYKHIKSIIIDTVNGVMVDAEFKRMKEKNFDKWTELATDVYGLINQSLGLRDDLTVFFTGHVEDVGDEMKKEYRLKTSGKKLQKIVLESKFSTVLFAKCKSANGISDYVFETQSQDSTAKSPFGMFDTLEIPNNLQLVADKISEYNNFEDEKFTKAFDLNKGKK